MDRTPSFDKDGRVLSVEIARRLRDAGLSWTPARGDRFVVADRGMDDEVFVLSDMTIEVHHYPGGPVIGFNGTTEWALDSVEQEDALWVPSEHQLENCSVRRLSDWRSSTTTTAWWSRGLASRRPSSHPPPRTPTVLHFLNSSGCFRMRGTPRWRQNDPVTQVGGRDAAHCRLAYDPAEWQVLS